MRFHGVVTGWEETGDSPVVRQERPRSQLTRDRLSIVTGVPLVNRRGENDGWGVRKVTG
jgi:hypothetical protein